jgi:hypothetical protein
MAGLPPLPPLDEAASLLRADYAATLAALTFNSRPIINTLTMLAEDHRRGAPIIADVIAAHLRAVRSPGFPPFVPFSSWGARREARSARCVCLCMLTP